MPATSPAATRRTPSAPRTPPAPPPALPDAHAAFVAAVRRDTPGTDLPRYVAILDALLAWSAARAARVDRRSVAGSGAALGFGRVGVPGVLWAARAARGGAPTLEITPPAGAGAAAAAALGACPATLSADGTRLRVGFGALKNAAALGAVVALLDDLLDGGPAVGAATPEAV